MPLSPAGASYLRPVHPSLAPRPSQPLWTRLFAGVGLLVYLWLSYLMLGISLQYVPPASDVAFLRIKQDAVAHWYYLPAFLVHAYSAILVLPAGLTQFSTSFRRRYPRWHRRLGWLYVSATLFAAGPSGLVLAWHANGGCSSQLAFGLLALGWLGFTAIAVFQALQKNWRLHRDFMIRSFALALSAITLRAWKYLLVAAFHPHPMDVYRWVAWLGWVLNLAFAEWFIYKNYHKSL